MVVEPIKFLYAANIRLDKPLSLGEGACAFVPRAKDAAYEAMRRLVSCALSRGVDFVLLRGELCDALCGPGALLFLTEQTTRLSAAGIGCYILNEGEAIDSAWLSRFPERVKWLDRSAELPSTPLPLTTLLESMPPDLQMLGPGEPDENGQGGAWLVSLSEDKEPEREFIELGALRWERCELDVTPIETDKDLMAAWKAVKDDFREREREPGPVLLSLKLTGVMKKPDLFYGEDYARHAGFLMKKLNGDELARITRQNFILVDSLFDDTSLPALPEPVPADSPSHTPEKTVERDFWEEMAFFKAGMDLRIGLFEALKDRGVLKRVLAADAAPFLEDITEADVESLLEESHDMALYGLFKARGFK